MKPSNKYEQEYKSISWKYKWNAILVTYFWKKKTDFKTEFNEEFLSGVRATYIRVISKVTNYIYNIQ